MALIRFLWTLCRAALLLVLLSLPARAHDPQLSSIKFIRAGDNKIVVSVSTHISQLGVSSTSKPAVETAIRRRLKVLFDGRAFFPGKSHIVLDTPNDLANWQAEHSHNSERIEVLSPLITENAGAHTAVSIIRSGRVERKEVINTANPHFDSSAPQAAGFGSGESTFARTVALNYLRQGFAHIWGGLDHVLFVLGLLLLGGTLRSLLFTVTAFTIAHSITLSIAALKIWMPSPRIVEPLIALSICVVAVENLIHLRTRNRERKRVGLSSTNPAPSRSRHGFLSENWRPLIAFTFGLIHGFGFAGALSELGLPQESLVVALATFNIGVELGQTAIVLLVAPILVLLMTRAAAWHRYIVIVGSCAIAFAGAWWFAQRVMGT